MQLVLGGWGILAGERACVRIGIMMTAVVTERPLPGRTLARLGRGQRAEWQAALQQPECTHGAAPMQRNRRARWIRITRVRVSTKQPTQLVLGGWGILAEEHARSSV